MKTVKQWVIRVNAHFFECLILADLLDMVQIQDSSGCEHRKRIVPVSDLEFYIPYHRRHSACSRIGCAGYLGHRD